MSELAKDEKDTLEKSLLQDGYKGPPIVVWEDTIIDGHNRYELCRKHNIPFEVQEMQFDSKEEVIQWMIRAQIGRRNLSKARRCALVRRFRPIYEKEAKENQIKAGGDKKSEEYKRTVTAKLPQANDASKGRNPTTDQKLAELANVSERTFRMCDKVLNSDNEGLKKDIENMEGERYPKIYAKTAKIMKPYLGQQLKSDKHTDEENKQDIEQQNYSKYLRDCHSQVFLTNYFHNRGLSDRIIDKFQLGFDQKKNIVTIPYNAGHEGTGYIHRVLWTSGNKYIKHGSELFNIDAIRTNDSNCVFITEGQIDAMSFEEIGYPALGLGSVNESNKLISLLTYSGTYKYLILALDNDVPGRKATGKIIEAIAETELPFGVMAMSWIYGRYKDPNEFLVKDRDGFEKQIKKIVSVI